MNAIVDLQNAVTAQNAEVAAVVTELQTLSAALTAAIAAQNPTAIEAAATQIATNTAALAAAVSAATPAPAASATTG